MCIAHTETLKYLYLLFADARDVGVDLMKYEFNTEAHLMPIAAGGGRASSGECAL
jgi:hypothetical protein